MIKQPNVIFGNHRLLVTMGKKGEVFGYFYPRRDHAQHVEESLACIHTGDRLLWTNDQEWTSTQTYIKDTNIVSTKLSHNSGIDISILDMVHPDVPVLIRRYRIRSSKALHGKLFYYSNINAGDMNKRNSCYCDPDERLLVQYWQKYYIGIKGVPDFDEWQVSKVGGIVWVTNSRSDMGDGKLGKNKEDIGNLNSAVGWDLNIEKDGSFEVMVLVGATQRERRRLSKRMRELSKQSIDDIFASTHEIWTTFLSKRNELTLSKLEDRPSLRDDLFNAYNRSLLTLNLLNEPKYGSFVAAPEFDSNFEMWGGYGFCWNRDAAEVVLALLQAGYPDYCAKFFEWCKITQLSDGSWFQRYWLDGNKAPSWGNFDHSTQIDETGATLRAMDIYYNTIEGIEKAEFLEDVWVSILCGAEYLMKRSVKGLHDPCVGIWETYSGVLSYTNAAVYAGLIAAADMAEEYNESGLARRWFEHANFVKRKTIDRMWLSEGYFARRIIDNDLDTTLDASILGTFVPFNMLSPHDPDERKMIYSIIEKIENELKVEVNGHYGIKRYTDDYYIGGNPWVVTTLWLSKTMLTLAQALQGEEGTENEQQRLMESALEYIKWSLRGTTSTGLLPEQVDRSTGRPAWAIPLGWSCALMIDNIMLIDSMR
ncbi:MAG: glucan 1,4-alpha-glucosidase [Methanosarcinaceae archaeon]|nr:glucan 1,4-alpha-glucosidase [Methanosarcinaceae archaeon]